MTPWSRPVHHLRWWRLARQWSQQDLAHRAHVTVVTIGKLEQPGARARLSTLSRLAQALAIPVVWLQGEESSPTHRRRP